MGKGREQDWRFPSGRKERVIFAYSGLKLGEGIRFFFFLSDSLWFSVLFNNVCVGLLLSQIFA